jgi:hypothetical protein
MFADCENGGVTFKFASDEQKLEILAAVKATIIEDCDLPVRSLICS